MSDIPEQFRVTNQRRTPIELHLPDGTVAVLGAAASLDVGSAARACLQLRELERQRIVRITTLSRPSAERGRKRSESTKPVPSTDTAQSNPNK